jgi:cobalt/nickel transport system ATP-binding protein
VKGYENYTMPELLRLTDIVFAYPESREPILNGLNFELGPNRRIGVIGPNGRGKTTFLHLCVGLLRPRSGQIAFKGRPLEWREKELLQLRKGVGLVFQNPDDQLFCPTVLEDVAFGPLNLGFRRDEAADRARWALQLVDMPGYENRITHKLSGGEKKALSLATILAMQPEAILLDEPSTGLDPESREHIARVLNDLPQSLVIVSHDWDFLARSTSELFTLDQGCLQETDRGALHKHVHYHPSGEVPHVHQSGLP